MKIQVVNEFIHLPQCTKVWHSLYAFFAFIAFFFFFGAASSSCLAAFFIAFIAFFAMILLNAGGDLIKLHSNCHSRQLSWATEECTTVYSMRAHADKGV